MTWAKTWYCKISYKESNKILDWEMLQLVWQLLKGFILLRDSNVFNNIIWSIIYKVFKIKQFWKFINKWKNES